jgi:hypothetical protein
MNQVPFSSHSCAISTASDAHNKLNYTDKINQEILSNLQKDFFGLNHSMANNQMRSNQSHSDFFPNQNTNNSVLPPKTSGLISFNQRKRKNLRKE